MPVPQVKELYVAQSLEMLNDKIQVKQNANPDRLMNSALRIYKEAIEKAKERDEELSYMYFMRFYQIVMELKSCPKYKAEPVLYDKMIGTENLKNAIVKAEQLGKSLEKRYNLKYGEKVEKEKKKIEEVRPPPPVEYVKSNGTSKSDDFISCSQLKSLWNQKSESYLVIDIRPSDDFKSSSMKFSNLVNIPEEGIKPGLTANSASKNMTANHRDLWSRRDKYDHLILCDYKTESSPFPKHFAVVIDAMKKWDPEKRYKCNQPRILKGGFDTFRYTYPLLVTDPKYEPKSTTPSTVTNGTTSLDFNYPDLNAAFIVSPEKAVSDKPMINRQTKPLHKPEPAKSVKNTNLDDVIEMQHLNKAREFIEALNTKYSLIKKHKALIEECVDLEKEALSKIQELDNLCSKQNTTDQSSSVAVLKIEIGKLYENIDKVDVQCQLFSKQSEDLKVWKQFVGANDISDSTPEGAKLLATKKTSLLKMKDEEESRLVSIRKREDLRRKRKEKYHETLEKMNKMLENMKIESAEKESRSIPPIPTTPVAKPKKSFQEQTSIKDTTDSYTTKLKSSPKSSPKRSGTNLRRSHSALHLNQFRDEHLESPLMPIFDRNLKPLESPRRRSINVARHRNFEPKYGNVGPGRTGLKNLGNTCYMNSIVQCLNSTWPLFKYFYNGRYSEDINEQSFQRGEIATEVGAVVQALGNGQFKSMSMVDLKDVIGRYYRPFMGNDQQDAHEFLIKMLDWLHDDLNRVRDKHFPMLEQDFNNVPDYLAAEQVMSEMNRREESIIRSEIHGLHRSVITCTVCDHRSLTFEPFSVLTLSFVAPGRCSLMDMVNDYYQKSHIEYNCARCKAARRCVRKMDIWKLPRILIIHLNRFEQDVLMKKNQSFVDFPLENFNLTQHLSNNSGRHHLYNLYGVCNHFGTMDGGHYTAICRPVNSDTWLRYDDNEVYEHSRVNVKSPAAYILFYEAANIR